MTRSTRRRSTFAGLALMVLFGCATRPAQSPVGAEFWKGCTAQAEPAGFSAQCTNDDMVVQFNEAHTAGATSPLARKALLGMAESILGQEFDQVELAPYETRIPSADGQRVRVVSVGEPLDGILLVVSKSAEALWLVICLDMRTRPPAPTCDDVTHTLGTSGEPPELGLTRPALDVQFAGRSLDVPEGCSTNTGEDIQCPPGASIAWETGDADAVGSTIASFVSPMLAELEQMIGRRLEPRSTGCLIEGGWATCQRYDVKLGGGTLVVLTGAAEVRGEQMYVMCHYMRDEVQVEPGPLCAQVVTLSR